jgi:hypothetical protein
MKSKFERFKSSGKVQEDQILEVLWVTKKGWFSDVRWDHNASEYTISDLDEKSLKLWLKKLKME